jgi:hypothetical protein
MTGQGGVQAPLNVCYLAAEIRKYYPASTGGIYKPLKLIFGY